MPDTEIRSLVVEDEIGTRRLLRDVLQARGHHVDACADAETAWATYERVRPDLVVLDLRLPGSDGLELCRKIRQVPDEHVPVVVCVTGMEERAELESALEAGADDYLQKPVDDERVHVRIAIAERRIRELRERREVEAHLRHDALHDRLTGLANRTFLRERIAHASRRSAREDSYLYALVLVDLWDFGSLNRRLGREAGDRILREAGARLEQSVRSVDTVARLEADRFAILLDGLINVSDPTRVTNRALQALSSPIAWEDERVGLTACIGIALSAAGYQEAAAILGDAYTALEEAKEEGPGSYRIHDPVMHARALARIELESRIRNALDDDEMEIRFQPMVRVADGRVRGFEALLRWEDPERGSMRPEDFIPVAEGSGLIADLGTWVLDRVLARLGEWRELAPDDDAPFVSINVSSKQFLQPDLAEQIGERLDSVDVDGRALHLEITETSLMDQVETAEQVLSALKSRSVRIQVDDFGTGYSSLSYLCRFPIDALKIDRSFIHQMTHSAENLEVVRTIVRLGENLGMTVVAEGVETERQLDVLREIGCDLAQGYLFSRPVPAAEAARLLRDGELA